MTAPLSSDFAFNVTILTDLEPKKSKILFFI